MTVFVITGAPAIVTGQILTYLRPVENGPQARRLIEGMVCLKGQSWRVSQDDFSSQLAAQECGCAVQCRDLSVQRLAAKRYDKSRRVLQVRRHPHLGDRHVKVGKLRVSQVAMDEQPRQGMAQFFTNPQLPLAWRLCRRFGRT